MSRVTLRLCLPIVAVLSGCASGPPTTVHLTLRAGPELNPDETGLPNPVQTHVYFLRAAETFNNTDYFQLADKEKSVLGADLLSEDNEIMRPGQTRELALPVPAGAKVVAVAASYRNIDQGTWRVVTPLRERIVLTMGPQTVQVVDTK